MDGSEETPAFPQWPEPFRQAVIAERNASGPGRTGAGGEEDRGQA